MTIDDHRLDRRLAELVRESEPDPAVWEAIEKRIAPVRRTPVFAAAAIALAVLAAAVVMMPRPSQVDRTLGAPGLAAEVRAMRETAPQALPAAISDPGGALVGAWRENRNAISELERALERDPDNRLLLEFLAEARLRQARLVTTGMTHETERRIDL